MLERPAGRPGAAWPPRPLGHRYRWWTWLGADLDAALGAGGENLGWNAEAVLRREARPIAWWPHRAGVVASWFL